MTLEEKLAMLPDGHKELINTMVIINKKAYDQGMSDAIDCIIEVINKMQQSRGLQVMTIDEIRRVLNDGKAAINVKL